MTPADGATRMVTAVAKSGHRRGQSYVPPEDVAATTLEDLLGGLRSISADQQQRLALGPAVDQQPSVRLWVAGDTALVRRPCVAIVGTREVTEAGAARARRLAKELAQAGVVVVSGLAKGVDTEALQCAIENGGKTIAVIGTPLDTAYPAENKRLQETIYREHLLVSQFPQGSRVFPGNFPQRNKVMAAITDATVIMEASDTSGTLHQAAECQRLGRWLFIAHAVVSDKALTWPAKFLGHPRARVLTDSRDLLAVLTA